MMLSLSKTSISAIAAAVLLMGCNPDEGEKQARLETLRQTGIDAERNATYQERLGIAMETDSSGLDVSVAGEAQTAELAELLRLTLDGNIEIGRAAKRIDIADAERLNAIFGYLPQISATGNYNQIQQNVISSDNAVFAVGKANYKSLDGVVEVTQPIFDLSRIFGIRIANTLRSAAEVDYIVAVQKASYDTFDAYVRAAEAKNAINLARQRSSLLRRQVATEVVRENEGLSDDAAKRSLEIELTNIEIEIADQQRTLSEHLTELFSLTGQRFDDVAVAGLPAGVQGTERRITVEQAVEQAVNTNPRVLRAIISVVEGDLRKKQAISADFSPVVAAFARLNYEKRDASRFGGGSATRDLVYGVRIVVPIFNARGTGYQMLTQRLNFEDARLEYLDAKRSVTSDVAATHQRLADISAAITQSRSALAKATQQTRAEELLVEAGTSDEFVVTALRARELQARQRIQSYEFEYLRTWGRLRFLMAENFSGDN